MGSPLSESDEPEEPVEEKRNPGSEDPIGGKIQLARAMKPGENLKHHASATPSVEVGGRGHGAGRRHRPSVQDPKLKMHRQITRPLSNSISRKRTEMITESYKDSSDFDKLNETESEIDSVLAEVKKLID